MAFLVGRRTILWQHMLQDYWGGVGTIYYNQAPQDYDKGGASLARQREVGRIFPASNDHPLGLQLLQRAIVPAFAL